MVTSIGTEQITVYDDTAKSRKDWQIVRFEQMAECITDRVDDPSEANVEYYVGLEHLDSESLKISRWGKPGDVEATKLRFKPGDIIFGKRRAYQRKVAVAEFEGICSAHAMVLRAREDVVLKDFLPFFMQSDTFFERALSISVGSLSPTINWKTLAQQEFALPPKDEQRRIADILWATDEMYKTRENLLNSVLTTRRLSIDQIFSNLSSSSVSTHATILKDVSKMQNGRSFPSEEYCEKGVRLLRPGNLGKNGYFYWNDDNIKYLPIEYLDTAQEYLINSGDVVINLTAQSLEEGFMGRVCLARENDASLLNQRIGRFICQNRILPEYLYRCLQTSSFRTLVETNCEGSKIKHLYWHHIENFPIQLPSRQKQQYLIKVLDAVDNTFADTEKNLKDANLFRRSLREKLLS